MKRKQLLFTIIVVVILCERMHTVIWHTRLPTFTKNKSKLRQKYDYPYFILSNNNY